MKIVAIVTLLLFITLTQCWTINWGMVQVLLKQKGLTTITEFLQEHMAFALRHYHFKEYRIFKLVINNIKVLKPDGMKTNVTIEPNNTIQLKLAFKRFPMEANITIDNPGDIMLSPATIIEFEDASLSLTLRLGNGEHGGVDVESCAAHIGNMNLYNVSQEMEALIQRIWRMGKQEIFEKVKELCPDLRKQSGSKYKGFLGLEEAFIINGDGPVPLTMDAEMNAIYTSGSTVTIRAVIGLDHVPLLPYDSHATTFPDPAELGLDREKEIEIWVDHDFVSLIGRESFQLDNVLPTSFTVFEQNDFEVWTRTQTASIDVTKKGMAMELSFVSTFVQTKLRQNCADMKMKVDLMLPFKLAINNTYLHMYPDPKRYQIYMKVQSLNIAYPNCAHINGRKEPIKWQRQVLGNFIDAFEEKFNHRFGLVRLFTDQYISLVDTTVETLEECMILTANIARGKGIIIEQTITTEHLLYTQLREHYTFADGQRETYVDGHLHKTISPGNRPTSGLLVTLTLSLLCNVFHML